jgi:ABC-2 type transport system ATP-binding protein
MTGPLVRMDGLTKAFGAAPPALDTISGAIMSGAVTGLVGPDGAGKTTLMRLMAGLLERTRGSLEVLGFDPATDAASIQASIGYMPQRFGLYEDLSVEENLHLYADLRGLPLSERAAVFQELLSFTDLGRFVARLAGNLSGGMKQKLGLACALVRKPRLLLLDEPSVGVDPISRRELWRMVSGLKGEGVGVVWSTAYLDEAEACDHVLLLNEGRLLFDGPPRGLTSRVDGRVFRVVDIEGRRRPVLAAALAEHEVIDGVIQGRATFAARQCRPARQTGGRRATLRGRVRRHPGRRSWRALEARRVEPDDRSIASAGRRGAGADQALWRVHRRIGHLVRGVPG